MPSMRPVVFGFRNKIQIPHRRRPPPGGIILSEIGGEAMSNLRRFFVALAVLASVGLLSFPALAQDCGCKAVATSPDPIPCISEGCSSEYYQEWCTVGCTEGVCTLTGYGMCCETPVKYYNVSPQQCNPPAHCGECGNARTRQPSHAGAQQSPGESRFNLEPQFYSADFPEEVLFVPDDCRHTYRAIYPRPLAPPTSRASSKAAPVPDSGGIL
jgi:hypothetical protein